MQGRRLIMEQLEERIVMDAAVDPIPNVDPFHWGMNAALPGVWEPSGTEVDTDAYEEPVSAAESSPILPPLNLASMSRMFEGNLDVLLISDALPASKQIAGAVEPHTKVMYYSAAHDDLDSITAKLADLTSRMGRNISHLAVVSPGDDGMLSLGSEAMDLDSTIAHRTAFKNLSGNLEPHAQIQLYACSLASSDDGKMLVNAIGTMTGADVYASTDVTGGKPHNWTLEYATYPAAPMVSLLNQAKLQDVPGHLGYMLGARDTFVCACDDNITPLGVAGSGTGEPVWFDAPIHPAGDTSGEGHHGAPMIVRVADAALCAPVVKVIATDTGSSR